jgi:hypothetical protein
MIKVAEVNCVRLQGSIATLNKIERRLGIPSVRRSKLPQEEATQAILDEVDQDIVQNNGPHFVKDKLTDKLILIPRRVYVSRLGLD